MQETVGTLNLKIAQLEQRLQVLKQQQFMSQTYPDFTATLSRKKLELQTQLGQLLKARDELLQQATKFSSERSFSGNSGRDQQSFWSTH
jgi:hypothetical protein